MYLSSVVPASYSATRSLKFTRSADSCAAGSHCGDIITSAEHQRAELFKHRMPWERYAVVFGGISEPSNQVEHPCPLQSQSNKQRS